MRPLVLKFRGLRSYREEAEVDFRGRDLVAIIGDTGAGKSSILEALCFALYGTATWSGKAVTDLISSGAPALSVQLNFRADGRTWTVNRTARATAAPSLHRLVADDDPSLHFDGAAAVNTQIKRLVGLDYDGFLRAVVLPQGRFQQLLQSTPGERSGVLKAIFRVHELEAVRSAAIAARNRVVSKLGDVRVERAKYFEVPAAVAAEAGDAVATATGRLKVLEAAAQDVRDCAAATEKERKLTGQLEAHTEAIARARRPDDAGRLRELAELEASLILTRNEASERADAHESKATAIAAQLRAADNDGMGAAGLASAVTTFDSAVATLPQIHDQEAALARQRQEISDVDGQIASRESAIGGLKKGADDAQAVVAAAELASVAARAGLTKAQAAAVGARAAVTQFANATREHREAVEESGRRQEELSAAAEAHGHAVIVRGEAETHLEDVRRIDHAAAAASGLGPGDPCPICARGLPSGFVSPHSGDEADARAAWDEAIGAESRTLKEHSRIEALSEAAIVAVTDKAARQAQADADSKRAIEVLRKVVPGADLADDDATLLRMLSNAADEAAESEKQARAGERKAALALETAVESLNGLRQELLRRSGDLARATTQLDHRRSQHEEALNALPTALRARSLWSADDLDEARTDAQNRLDVIRQQEGERDQEYEASRKGRQERDAAAERLETEVRTPAAELNLAQAAFQQCLATVAHDLRRDVPQSPPGGDLSDAAELAVIRDAWATELHDACTADISQATLRAAESEKRGAQALASAGCHDGDELREAIIAVTSDLRQAEGQHSEALRQQPLVALLDERIARATALVTALDVVYTHLSDAKFIDYVIRQRQLVLLAVASEVMASMTNSRYGFAEDFRIVDSWSGQPRDVMTLSGGETFLASLSLALALVELAGRGGGRLEALFLDEGFGSLDANTLPDALRALESQSSDGRLVAVISHLRAVAETIEDVLHVVRGPDGSKARWLTAQERDALLNSDAESGLLA